MIIFMIEFSALGFLSGYLYFHCLKNSVESFTTSMAPLKTFLFLKLVRISLLCLVLFAILKLDGLSLVPFSFGFLLARNLTIGRYISYSPIKNSKES